MQRSIVLLLTAVALAATAEATTAVAAEAPAPAASTAAQAHEHPHQPAAEPAAVDQGGQQIQPAYADGRLVSYRPAFDAPAGATAATLYEVEYPAAWWTVLARPLCSYCDHLGDGRNAWDFHDHVLDRRPSAAANRAGTVYWRVVHVRPAYTGKAGHDAAVTKAYAAQLPAQSGRVVRRLLATRLPNGSAVAVPVDTGFVFRGPLTRGQRR